MSTLSNVNPVDVVLEEAAMLPYQAKNQNKEERKNVAS